MHTLTHKNQISIIAVIAMTILVLFACEERDYNTDASAHLWFSTDTLSFDTVFTSIGSATLYFKVYNKYDQDLEIDEIRLENGASSNFRINIDGASELSVNNKLLRKQDSMYIFVDVNVDPNDTSTPFLIEDQILFNTNGLEQSVKLQAYGQDAYHITLGEWGGIGYQIDEETGDTVFMGVTLNHDTTLYADKPYYLHDDFVVNQNVSLQLEAGVQFFIEKDKSIYVLGSLKSNGSLENPVVFRGDRLDDLFTDVPYDKVPGQWGVIALQSSSYDNYFKHTHIRNGLIGLYVDSLSVNEQAKVKLENCRIENMSSAAIYSLYGDIEAENCLFANCEQYVLGVSAGGKYAFTNCTFGNHYDWGGHTDPSVVLTNYYIYNDEIIPIPLLQADFTNCIISGTASSELSLSNTDEDGVEIDADFNFSFKNCLIKADLSEIDTSATSFEQIIWNEDPLFISPADDWDFHPDTLSPVIDRGRTTHLSSDLNEIPYTGAPDIGAFEYIGSSDEE